MAISVAEFQGVAVTGSGPSRVLPIPEEPALALTQVSSGGSTAAQSTITFNAATELVAIALTSNGFFFFGSSTRTSTEVTSTNVQFMPAPWVELRGVRPNGKLFCWST